jgi:hypothetical protein
MAPTPVQVDALQMTLARPGRGTLPAYIPLRASM